MTKEDIMRMAEASGVEDSLLYEHWRCNLESMTRFAKLVVVSERDAVLQTIEALYDSEDPTPMYQEGYNHALDHIEQFVKARSNHDT